MVNHFRTLLLNLSDVGDTSEHIAKGFAARTLSSKLQPIYTILFPAGTTRQQKLDLGLAYTQMIYGAGIDEVFTLTDSRITYDLSKDFARFKSTGLDFEVLLKKLQDNTTAVRSMLTTIPTVDTDKYDNMYLQHTNSMYRVAGLIAAYVIRLT